MAQKDRQACRTDGRQEKCIPKLSKTTKVTHRLQHLCILEDNIKMVNDEMMCEILD